MTLTEAKQVIEVLARGIDPETGVILPDDSPLNSPHVIRALFLAANALEQEAEKQPKPGKKAPANTGKAWTAEQDEQLVQSFDSGIPVTALAKAHQRTAGAITSRLIRLGRLQVNPAKS